MWEEKSCNAVSDLMIIHYIIIDFWSACGLYRKIKDYAAISILLKWQWCKILLFTIVMWNEAVKSLYGLCLSQLFDYMRNEAAFKSNHLSWTNIIICD